MFKTALNLFNRRIYEINKTIRHILIYFIQLVFQLNTFSCYCSTTTYMNLSNTFSLVKANDKNIELQNKVTFIMAFIWLTGQLNFGSFKQLAL